MDKQVSEILNGVASLFASVRLTVVLLSLTAITVLAGAWCPQEGQVGQDKVIEQFGPQLANVFIVSGVADIFHTPWFLALIGCLTINIIVGSVKHVFPKLILLREAMPTLGREQIVRLPIFFEVPFVTDSEILKKALVNKLSRWHYFLHWQGDKLTADFGKFARTAPSITHVGLLTLLTGVTVSAWTGFSGFKPVTVGEDLFFQDSEHSKLWVGHLPTWHVHVNESRAEVYETGEPKQWFSSLSVLDGSGKKLVTKEISVNDPLSYAGVDVYQSSWGLSELALNFNGHKRKLALRPMGKLYAAFLPLDQNSVLIFSLRNQTSPVRIFAKRPDWTEPRLITEIPLGHQVTLGTVLIGYEAAHPTTGLQYKCDPGLPITFTAFGFIILGVILAAIPHRQVWAELTVVPALNGDTKEAVLLTLGGRSNKAKVGFERQLNSLLADLKADCDRAQISEQDPIDGKIQGEQVHV